MLNGCGHCAHMTRCHPYVPASALAGHEPCDEPSNGYVGAPASLSAQRCALVVTRLAPGVGAVVVADIFKRCRERHGQFAITGTILFDGERFGMLCCGTPDHVRRALEAITSDPRQTLPLILADASQVPAWAAQSWYAGWCEPDALAALTGVDAPRGPAAVNVWRALLAASDLL